MSHNLDFQKDEIMAAMKRENKSSLARVQSKGNEFRMQPISGAKANADSASQTQAARIEDWWKPEPDDPFWMLEAEDGEWLKNEHSLLGTRDASRAIRFPTKADAMNHPARMKADSKWWSAKATEHTWITATREGSHNHDD